MLDDLTLAVAFVSSNELGCLNSSFLSFAFDVFISAENE